MDVDAQEVEVARSVPVILDGLWLPGGVCSPPGWLVTPRGIWKRKKGGIEVDHLVSQEPILVVGRQKNVSSGKARVTLAWRTTELAGERRWVVKNVSRSVITDKTQLAKLGEDGAPVHSGNAAELVAFLAAWEAEVASVMPVGLASQAMGWQKDGSFVLGNRIISRDGDELAAEQDPRTPWSSMPVMAYPEGLEGLTGGFRVSGSEQVWRQLALKMSAFPGAWVALLGAMCPPLLKVVGASSFVMEWAGITSLGKSTSLRLAGSVWGSVKEGDHETVFNTWEQTRVWIERAAGVAPDLPLILDDTQKAVFPDQVQRVIYDVASGQGRGRGTVSEGAQRRVSWSTVLLSTGEAPASSIGKQGHGGAAARLLSMWGSPLGGESAENDALATDLKQITAEHFGHLGLALVRWLVQLKAQAWCKEVFRAELRRWKELARGNAVASRAAEYVALLALANRIACDVFDFPDAQAALDVAWTAALSASSAADRATHAALAIISWAGEVSERIEGRSSGKPSGPGYVGRWEQGGYLAIRARVMRERLHEMGFQAEAVIQTWAERRWLKTRRGALKQVRIMGAPDWCVVFDPAVLIQLVGDSAGEDGGEQ